ncbi:MAG: prolyl oligopeptidase family serine peptidase [Povalibacter sp.]
MRKTVSISVAAILLLSNICACASESTLTIERTATLRALFPENQIEKLAGIMPPDREVHWDLHVPEDSVPHGVLVFVSPMTSTALTADWAKVLDQHNLIWVAARDYGNPVPANQRMLAALMGLTLVQQNYAVDSSHVYIAGMSGGGRVASMTVTTFPQLFTGALYIVGVDFWSTKDPSLLEQINRRRYVFMTGDKDFNRSEVRLAYKRYRDAGATQSLLMDLPHFGHEYPRASQLDKALQFLAETSTPDK